MITLRLSRRIRWQGPLLLSLLSLTACAGSSPTADWSTGKDILDGLKANGFSCDWSGPGEQVVLSNPLTGEEAGDPAVRCDGYGIALIPSQAELLEAVARESRCEPITAEDRSGEAAQMTVVVGPNFVVVPNGEFPASAQPEDFTKAFGGEVLTLLDLYEEACQTSGDPFPSGADDTGAPESQATEGAAPPRGMVNVGGQLVPAVSVGDSGQTLELWIDPQAPAAGALAEASLPDLVDLASSGAYTLVLRPAAFLDDSLANDASIRAIAATGCAMEQGLGAEYMITVLANQPADEGLGWTDDDLVAWGADLGLDQASLRRCVDSGTYMSWAEGTAQAFESSGVPGVPYAELEGVEVDTATLADPVAFEERLN